jgi:hypothetical protein
VDKCALEEDPQQVDNPCVIHEIDSIIFLHDPFERKRLQDQQNNTFVYGKARVNDSIKLCLMTNNIL